MPKAHGLVSKYEYINGYISECTQCETQNSMGIFIYTGTL